MNVIYAQKVVLLLNGEELEMNLVVNHVREHHIQLPIIKENAIFSEDKMMIIIN